MKALIHLCWRMFMQCVMGEISKCCGLTNFIYHRSNSNWCICGDFNSTCSHGERKSRVKSKERRGGFYILISKGKGRV